MDISPAHLSAWTPLSTPHISAEEENNTEFTVPAWTDTRTAQGFSKTSALSGDKLFHCAIIFHFSLLSFQQQLMRTECTSTVPRGGGINSHLSVSQNKRNTTYEIQMAVLHQSGFSMLNLGRWDLLPCSQWSGKVRVLSAHTGTWGWEKLAKLAGTLLEVLSETPASQRYRAPTR